MAKKPQVNIKEQTTVAVTDDIREFISDLVADVTQDDLSRETYLNKLINAYDQRMQNVNEDDVPWPGAPNYSMPWTDKHIRKRKAVEVAAFLNAKTLAKVNVAEGVFDPPSPESAQVDPQTGQPIPGTERGQFELKAEKAETALNLFLRKKMDWPSNMMLGIDYRLEKGRCYFKVFEGFEIKRMNRVLHLQDFVTIFGEDTIGALRELTESELMELLVGNTGFGFDIEDDDHVIIMKDIIKRFKAGEEDIEFVLPVVESKPVIEAIPPEDIIVPPEAQRNIQDNMRVTHEFWLTKKELLDAADTGKYNQKVVEDKLGSGSDSSGQDARRRIDIIKDLDEGITQVEAGETYLIWEIHHYKKRKGVLEKWVATVFAKDSNAILSYIREPNGDDEFPFVEVDFEIRDDRAYASRGIPEMLRNVQMIIDDQENNRIRRDIITNTPMFGIRRQSGLTSQSVQFIPGQAMMLDNPAQDMVPFNYLSTVQQASERIEQAVKVYGEEYIGSVDFGLNAGQLPGVGKGSKTLGEIKFIAAEGQKITSLDFKILNDAISRVYKMVFNLLRDRMNQNIQLESSLITREDFNFPAEVVANGVIEESDKQFRMNQALQRMQVTAMQSPAYVTEEDKYNAYADYLEADGVRDTERFSTDPAQVINSQLFQAQQQLGQMQGQMQVLSKELDSKERQLVAVEEKGRRTEIKNQVKNKIKSAFPKVTNTREVTTGNG